MNLDPRIGQLNSGKFYAFAHGYAAPAVEGTLEEVEAALGLRQTAKATTTAQLRQTFTAAVKSPDGCTLRYSVVARNKTEARKLVRECYREDVPSPRYGFYSFESCRLTWES